VKLLIDMNLAPRWVEFLQQAGHEATHWSALGVANASDTELMQRARELDYVVLTHDLDFSAILAASGGAKPSVIQIRADALSPEDIGRSVLAALALLEQELKAGALLTIEPARTRVRLLPLRI
jgi:predicted nuclease of predicted toxin-antitoxin system